MTEVTLEAIGELVGTIMDEKLKGFATKEYLDQKLESFATKDYLEEKLDEKLKEFPNRQELKNEISILSGKIDDIKEVVDRIDRRTDEDIRTAYRDIEKHETRITRLEKVVMVK